MRFSLQTLFIAISVIALLCALAAWHPLLAAFAGLTLIPSILLFYFLWRSPAAILFLASLAAAFLVNMAAKSYFVGLRATIEPRETCYELYLHRGRILAFRYEKWLPPVNANFGGYEAGNQEWISWPGYVAAKRRYTYSAYEYACGGYLPPFDLRIMRHRQFEYTMVGFALVSLAAALWLAGLARCLLVCMVWGPAPGAAQTVAASDQNDKTISISKSVSPTRLECIGGRFALFAVWGSAASLVLLLLGRSIGVLTINTAPVPADLPIFTCLLFLPAAAAGSWLTQRLPDHARSQINSVWFPLMGLLSIATIVSFTFEVGLIIGPLSEETVDLLYLGRLTVILVLGCGGLLFAVAWDRCLGFLSLSSATVAAMLACSTLLVDLEGIGHHQRDFLRAVLLAAIFLNAVIQAVCVVSLPLTKLRKNSERPILFAVIAIVLFFISLITLDADFGQTTTSEISKAIWQLRSSGILVLSGLCIYLQSRRDAFAPKSS